MGLIPMKACKSLLSVICEGSLRKRRSLLAGSGAVLMQILKINRFPWHQLRLLPKNRKACYLVKAEKTGLGAGSVHPCEARVWLGRGPCRDAQPSLVGLSYSPFKCGSPLSLHPTSLSQRPGKVMVQTDLGSNSAPATDSLVPWAHP